MPMRRMIFTILAMAVLFVPLGGCEWNRLRVRIPDFDSNDVVGLWIWRRSEATGQYVRDGQVVFFQPEIVNGRERMKYEVRRPDGLALYDLAARVIRSGANPDSVTVRLQYVRISPPGSFKISSFNQFGDSPLSNETLFW